MRPSRFSVGGVSSIAVADIDDVLFGSSRLSIRRVDTAGPSASASHDYESANVMEFGTAASASRELLIEPGWRRYIRERLTDLYQRVDQSSYPRLETLNGAWAIAHKVLGADSWTPSVLPGEDRSIDLVWNRGRWHVELEISDDEPYVWAKNVATGEVVSGELDELHGVLRDLLAEISAS